ncbi:hypothetical protein AB9T89_17245 [Flavobacterium oncorhynchi]
MIIVKSQKTLNIIKGIQTASAMSLSSVSAIVQHLQLRNLNL